MGSNKILAGLAVTAVAVVGSYCVFFDNLPSTPDKKNDTTVVGKNNQPKQTREDKSSSDKLASGVDYTPAKSGDSKAGSILPKNQADRKFVDKSVDKDPEITHTVELVKPSENPTIKKLSKKMYSKKATLRDTSVAGGAKLKPFDKSIMSDPQKYQAYLSEHVPARANQAAQPGKDVPVLAYVSQRFFDVTTGETVTLKVRTAPNAPATFTAVHLGTFSNKLTSITVKADAKGIATAELTASGGAYADCEVMVASPLASGKKKFLINISTKK